MSPRIPRPRLPRRRGKAGAEDVPAPESGAPAKQSGDAPEPGKTEPPKDGPKPAPKPGEKPEIPARPASVEERLDGIGSWLAQVDRKLGIRTYALGAALVLALAAAAVSLVLVLQLRDDAATKDDIGALSEQISAAEESAAQTAAEEIDALGDRMSQLESRVTALQGGQTDTDQQISVLEDDLADLRSQITELEADIAAAAADSAPPP